MKTLRFFPVILFILFIVFHSNLSGQNPNFQFDIAGQNENSILIRCSFSNNIPITVKPSCMIALPGETVESIVVKKIGINGSSISTGCFSDQFISTTSIITIRGYHLLKLEINPFIKLKKNIPISSLTVEIKYGLEGLSESSQRLRSNQWDRLVKSLVINPKDVGTTEFRLPSRDEDGVEYLIITHDLFLEKCRELVDFRIRQGISTLAVPLTETGSTTGEIKTYIDNAYNSWDIPPISVLLIGDWELLPGPVWQSYCASDNIYADINQDGLPDIFISRIPVMTIAELETILEKIISHETNPPMNPDYYQHPLACTDHSNPYSNGWMVSEIFNGWYEKEFNKEPERQYAGLNPGSTNWPNPDLYQVFGPDGLGYIPETPEYLGNYIGGNAQGINAGLNSGAMTLFSYTHGNSAGWSPPSYSTYDLSGLTDAEPTYLISINDMNGKYNISADCMAEAFLKHPHGGIGVIAPSEITYSMGTEWYSIGVIDGLWDNFYPPNNPTHFYSFIYPCMANTSAKYFLEFLPYPISPTMKTVVYNLFHYFGEPYSVLFDDVPEGLNVDHADHITPGQTEFLVTANDGSKVALVLNDKICSVETSTGNQMSMPILGPSEGDTLHITVTMHNHVRYHALAPCQTGIGVEDNTVFDLIDIFPNPADEAININFKHKTEGLIQVSLVDLSSRELINTQFRCNNATGNIFTLNTKDLDNGIYLLNFRSMDYCFSEKLIIKH